MMAISMATAWIFRKEIKRKCVVPAIAIVTVVVIMLFYMKMGSAMGRIVIWRQALGMITDKPIFGYGIGTFGITSNSLLATWRALAVSPISLYNSIFLYSGYRRLGSMPKARA